MRSVSGVYLSFFLAAISTAAWAQTDPALAQSSAQLLTCESTGVDKVHCAADTSQGVVLLKSIGAAECLLGRTWGYDDKGVWVSYQCSGVFALANTATAPSEPPPPRPCPRNRPHASTNGASSIQARVSWSDEPTSASSV